MLRLVVARFFSALFAFYDVVDRFGRARLFRRRLLRLFIAFGWLDGFFLLGARVRLFPAELGKLGDMHGDKTEEKQDKATEQTEPRRGG